MKREEIKERNKYLKVLERQRIAESCYAKVDSGIVADLENELSLKLLKIYFHICSTMDMARATLTNKDKMRILYIMKDEKNVSEEIEKIKEKYMGNKFTIQQAEDLETCPKCGCMLRDEKNNSKLHFMYNREMDCITSFICPNCETVFLRDEEELKITEDKNWD